MKKALFSAAVAFACLSHSALAEEDRLVNLERIAAIQQRDLASLMAVVEKLEQELSRATPPVGSILQTFARDLASQHLAGVWVPCDGRNVSGSAWEKKGLGSAVPNVNGLFLRATGGKALPLGQMQAQATAVNGLTAAGVASDVTGSIGNDKDGAHVHETWEPSAWGHPDGAKPAKRVHSYHDVETPYRGSILHRMTGGAHKHSFSLKAGGQKVNMKGDSETRPDNISVNVFCRVN